LTFTQCAELQNINVRFGVKSGHQFNFEGEDSRVVGHHRTANALQIKLTHRLDRHSILDLREHPRTNQDLPGLCFIAEPRSGLLAVNRRMAEIDS
jgi:hypothetical protein